jgi:hypothetical protein
VIFRDFPPLTERLAADNRHMERKRRMSGSVAALFQRLTQGVYVVGVAHARCAMPSPPPG